MEKSAYIMVSVAAERAEALKAVRREPFFLYMLAEVASEESLREYGVNTDRLPDIRRAWRRMDLTRASELVGDAMIDVLTVCGRPGEAEDRLEEYLSAGLDLAILTPVGDLKRGLETFAPG